MSKINIWIKLQANLFVAGSVVSCTIGPRHLDSDFDENKNIHISKS